MAAFSIHARLRLCRGASRAVVDGLRGSPHPADYLARSAPLFASSRCLLCSMLWIAGAVSMLVAAADLEGATAIGAGSVAALDTDDDAAGYYSGD